MGCRISLLAGPEAGYIRYSTRLSRRHHLIATVDGTQDPLIIDQIRELHRNTPFDLLVPGDLAATELLARISDTIGIPTYPLPSIAVVRQLADKARFAELCQELALPIPKTISLWSKAEIDINQLVAELGLPLVIKPTNEQGGNGVVTAHTTEMIRTCILENDDYSFAPLIAQEHVGGVDIGVSFVARDGEILCIGAQIPHHGWIEFTTCPVLETAAEELCSYLKYTGAAQFDGRLDTARGKAVFVECNPRFWGTISSSLWAGTNFVELGLRTTGERSQVETGRISMRPLRFCLNLVSFRLDPRGLTRAQLVGVWLALSDPLPLLHRIKHAIRGSLLRRQAKAAEPHLTHSRRLGFRYPFGFKGRL
jgi:biotin carboxylase